MADQCGYKLGNLYWCIDDAYVYLKHIDTLKKQLSNPINQSKPTISLPSKYDEKGNLKSFF
ncbi:thymidylate synthase [Staphylococcus epidermidis]|nr:thymidylate synthase [Staphylococcus epidermidis]MCG2112378.1 thymidylate synthase [Staphylococcus epidermidis]